MELDDVVDTTVLEVLGTELLLLLLETDDDELRTLLEVVAEVLESTVDEVEEVTFTTLDDTIMCQRKEHQSEDKSKKLTRATSTACRKESVHLQSVTSTTVFVLIAWAREGAIRLGGSQDGSCIKSVATVAYKFSEG